MGPEGCARGAGHALPLHLSAPSPPPPPPPGSLRRRTLLPPCTFASTACGLTVGAASTRLLEASKASTW